MVEIPVRRRGARMEDISERESIPEPQLGKSAKQAAHGAVDKTADVAHAGIDRADIVVEKARETVQPVVERAKEVAQPAKEAVKEAVRPAKEAAERTKRVVKEKAAGIRERTLQIMDQTAHRIEEEGRETRNILLRGLDFIIGSLLFPVRWAWNANMNLWKLIPSTAGIILGTLFFFAASWFLIGELLLPWIFEESSYEYPEYGRHRFHRSEFYDRNIPDGERLYDWKNRLKETMRRGFPPMEDRYEHEEEPGSPDYRSSMGYLERSRRNKIRRYVDHLQVDNNYRIRREIRHLREQTLGRGGIIKWSYNRFLDIGNSLGRRWNHMSIDAKYALSNAWNTLSYYALAPFRTIEHTAERGWNRVKRGAEKGWSRVKQRTEDFTEGAKRRAQRGAQRMGETLERPVREFQRGVERQRHEPLSDRNQYNDYDRYERERPYDYDRRSGDWFTRRRQRRGDESVVDKASDVFLGSKDYLQEKAGQATEWTKEKAGEAVEWTREKLPKDLHEFGELISDAMDEMDDQYRSAKEGAMEEIHELQERIEQRKYERSPFGWLASWFW